MSNEALETEFVARRRGEISDFGFRISDWFRRILALALPALAR